MARIAITGGIACGKSLLSSFLRELGAEIIDADDIVHELIPADERRRLAKIVFSNPAERKALEERIHPIVRERINEFLRTGNGERVTGNGERGTGNRGENRKIDESKNRKIAIIPLLFEVGWDREFDIICTITSPVEQQIERMISTRGYTREEALARIAAQMPVEEKAARSHYVIHNDSTPENLRTQAKAFYNSLIPHESLATKSL